MHITRFLKRISILEMGLYLWTNVVRQFRCLHGSETWLRTMVDTSILLMLEGKEHIEANLPAFLKIKYFINNAFTL
jgi:hypothetical protein